MYPQVGIIIQEVVIMKQKQVPLKATEGVNNGQFPEI